MKNQTATSPEKPPAGRSTPTATTFSLPPLFPNNLSGTKRAAPENVTDLQREIKQAAAERRKLEAAEKESAKVSETKAKIQDTHLQLQL